MTKRRTVTNGAIEGGQHSSYPRTRSQTKARPTLKRSASEQSIQLSRPSKVPRKQLSNGPGLSSQSSPQAAELDVPSADGPRKAGSAAGRTMWPPDVPRSMLFSFRVSNPSFRNYSAAEDIAAGATTASQDVTGPEAMSNHPWRLTFLEPINTVVQKTRLPLGSSRLSRGDDTSALDGADKQPEPRPEKLSSSWNLGMLSRKPEYSIADENASPLPVLPRLAQHTTEISKPKLAIRNDPSPLLLSTNLGHPPQRLPAPFLGAGQYSSVLSPVRGIHPDPPMSHLLANTPMPTASLSLLSGPGCLPAPPPTRPIGNLRSPLVSQDNRCYPIYNLSSPTVRNLADRQPFPAEMSGTAPPPLSVSGPVHGSCYDLPYLPPPPSGSRYALHIPTTHVEAPMLLDSSIASSHPPASHSASEAFHPVRSCEGAYARYTSAPPLPPHLCLPPPPRQSYPFTTEAPWSALYDSIKSASNPVRATGHRVNASEHGRDQPQVTREVPRSVAARVPHPCPFCPRTFSLPNGLAIHLKWHWGASGLEWKKGISRNSKTIERALRDAERRREEAARHKREQDFPGMPPSLELPMNAAIPVATSGLPHPHNVSTPSYAMPVIARSNVSAFDFSSYSPQSSVYSDSPYTSPVEAPHPHTFVLRPVAGTSSASLYDGTLPQTPDPLSAVSPTLCAGTECSNRTWSASLFGGDEDGCPDVDGEYEDEELFGDCIPAGHTSNIAAHRQSFTLDAYSGSAVRAPVS
ncbi:hypothetical protein FKP32DRAFT_517555 [Trametes sanguinea]|nr:hypothetical protein FKP32DRAFT_517555 [Trametes sanguinea]